MSTTDELAERVKQLEAENRRLVAMVDALDDHLLLYDPSARILFLNQATEQVARGNFGRSRAELIGTRLTESSLSPSFTQYIVGLITRAAAGETVGEEFLLPMPDGAVWHEHRYHPVRAPSGEVEAVAVSSRDIQARKQAEGRLQLLSKVGLLASTPDLEGLLGRAASLAIPELADWSVFEVVRDGTRDCVAVSHPDRTRAQVAERTLGDAARSTRVDHGELGATIYRLGIDDDALRARNPALHAVLAQLAATTAIIVPFVVMGAPIAIATFAYGPESGRRHAAADLPIADEVARRAAQIVENARLHSDLAEALQYRERVMGILGHDLRNPVSAILSLSSTLSQRADVPERSKQGLLHIHAAADRMAQMIATILDFTKLRFRGVPSLSLEAVNVEALVQTVVDELRAADSKRTITIDARGELRGRWDASRLGQVVSNLVGNALAHGNQDSPVTVSVTSDDASVFVAVTNRGPTIPPEMLDKLYEPFWQAPKPGAAKSRGLGLGLFIAKQIVNAHNGEIVARSQDGQTTFTVRLPR